MEYVVVSAAFNDADYIRVGNRIDALRNSRNIPDGTEDDKLNASELLEEITPVINELVEPKDQARVVMKELRKVVRNYFKQSVEMMRISYLHPYIICYGHPILKLT